MCHKKDELKQLKSELAALDRKIQLEFAPPTPEVAEKEKDGQEVKPDAEGVQNMPLQPTEDAPQIRSPSSKFIADHIIVGLQDFKFNNTGKIKGVKL